MTEQNNQITPIRILVIAGPTAAGKTAFAIECAKRYGGEIVSCDSMQLYRHMDIGSAKPTAEERAMVPHHLVDCIDPSAPNGDFSAAKYANLAGAAIRDIASRGRLPIVCGGTGLYLNALLYEMDFSDAPQDEAYRAELSKIAQEKGPAALHEMLQAQDPEAADRIHPNNVKKVIRALERIRGGEGRVRPFDQIRRENPLYDPVMVCVTRKRSELYARINARVLDMIDAGLADEVRGLLELGLTPSHISMLGIGYKEIIPYLAGESTLEDAIAEIQKNTRHLAKRQLTWFRRYDKMFWLDVTEHDNERGALEALYAWLDPRL